MTSWFDFFFNHIIKTFLFLQHFLTSCSVCFLLKETEGGSVSSDNSNKENGQLPEEEEPGGTEPTPKQVSNTQSLTCSCEAISISRSPNLWAAQCLLILRGGGCLQVVVISCIMAVFPTSNYCFCVFVLSSQQ